MVKIPLDPGRTGRFLVHFLLVLLLLHAAGQILLHTFDDTDFYGSTRKFSLDEESNVPTFYSAILLLAASFLLFVISREMGERGDADARRWLWLSVIFLCMAVDEAAAVHELLIRPMQQFLSLPGLFFYSWVIAGFVATLVVALLYYRFLMNLPRDTKVRFLVAGVIFVAGALGVEMIGGWYISRFGEYDTAYALITTVEELLELAGVSIFIHALVRFMNLNNIAVQIGVREQG